MNVKEKSEKEFKNLEKLNDESNELPILEEKLEELKGKGHSTSNEYFDLEKDLSCIKIVLINFRLCKNCEEVFDLNTTHKHEVFCEKCRSEMF